MKNSGKDEEQWLTNPEVQKAFEAFKEMRRRIKKPLTDYAEELLIKKLSVLCQGDPQKAVAILDRSILNCWQGIF
jgi:hypothetical protein